MPEPGKRGAGWREGLISRHRQGGDHTKRFAGIATAIDGEVPVFDQQLVSRFNRGARASS